uniref:Uncharacterized protein n=1 Tax=Arundo donax TaxID=35708 RepID=A0A0A8YTD3_ARUDO
MVCVSSHVPCCEEATACKVCISTFNSSKYNSPCAEN